MIRVCHVSTSHLPDVARVGVCEGQTLRQALGALRAAGRREFGDLGTMHADLSDGTILAVLNQAGHDRGTQLLASQRVCRLDMPSCQLLRYYPW